MVLIWIGGLVLGGLLMTWATKRSKLPLVTFLALPELALGLAGIVLKVPILVWSSVIGGNIADISMIIGLVAMFGGGVAIIGDYLTWQLGMALLVGAGPIFLALDGNLSRLDGVILLLIYLIYAGDSMKKSLNMKKTKELSWRAWVLPIVVLVLGALILTSASVGLATVIMVPLALVGLTLTGLIMSLLELWEERENLSKKKVVLVLEKVIKKMISSSTLVVGMVAILMPIKVNEIKTLGVAGMVFIVMFSFFWIFSRTKKKLTQGEGVILFGLYLISLGIIWLL